MALEITAIVCGTIAFLFVFTVGAAMFVARKAATTPAIPTLDEIFEQAKTLVDRLDLR